MAKKKGFWGKITGEMSNLREKVVDGWRFITGSGSAPYSLDTTKVDYKQARKLYKNTDERYKLGAVFAKPVINTTVGFMGVPRYKMDDINAQGVVDEFLSAYRSLYSLIIRNSVLDGDCFVVLEKGEEADAALYPEKTNDIVPRIIPPGQLSETNGIVIDPRSGIVMEYNFEVKHEWVDTRSSSPIKRTAIVKVKYTKEKTVIEVDRDVPPDMKPYEEITNKLGFLPIVHFKNEADVDEMFGTSDLEAIEPMLRAYHDVMIHAITGSKLHSTPRLKLKVKDIQQFVASNFGINNLREHIASGKTLNFDGKEIFIMGQDDDAGFVEARSTTGDATTLLEFLFYCIVDASETPEFVFGVHTPSALASVKEQMPILVRKIERKRVQFDEPLKRLIRMYLSAKTGGENARLDSYDSQIIWEDIDPRTGTDVAKELLDTVKGLVEAMKNGIISQEAAVDHLSTFVPTMNKWDDEEVEEEMKESVRIMRTRLAMQGLEDSQYLNEEEKTLLEAARKRQEVA